MKRLSGISLGLVIVAFAFFGCASNPFSDEGWVTLIDGSPASLDHWDRIGSANWRVANGAVEADKAGKDNGYLVSKQSYKDFQIRAEFWVSDDANSGIFIRASDPKKIGAVSAYEVNIFDKRPDPSYGTGAIVNVAKAKVFQKAGGKWNTYDITAKGDRMIVILNGQETVDVRDSKFSSGPFALQYGGGVVKFRKLQIRPL